jgi:outer membrane protein OmpA-like peptidoglycan-associated protein
MVANPSVSVIVTGHTDNVGGQKFNQDLSLKRAQAVRNWLVKKGIASRRMRTVGRGLNEPVASNETDEGRAENRRIEFYVEK